MPLELIQKNTSRRPTQKRSLVTDSLSIFCIPHLKLLVSMIASSLEPLKLVQTSLKSKQGHGCMMNKETHTKTMDYRSVFHPQLFQGKRVIVTGGGTGIGRTIAHELCSLGAHGILLGRRSAPLATTVTEILSQGGRADYAVCDIRDEQTVNQTISQIIDTYGPVDYLVNNAGGQFTAPLTQLNQKGFETVIRTNLTGGFLVSKAVFKYSMQKTGGAIVNMIADMWRGMPGMGHSGAARAGMENLTRTAAFEWASFGVRVNAIAPGWIASSGLNQYEKTQPNLVARLQNHVPLKRLGTEAEVSASVCFLLSPAASFITGATLRIDGGAPLGHPLFPLLPAKNNLPYEGFQEIESTPELENEC